MFGSVDENNRIQKNLSVVALGKFAEDAGVSSVTCWRWRRLGWIKTLNIAGRQYISAEEIDRFKARAANGEFSREHRTPRCGRSSR